MCDSGSVVMQRLEYQGSDGVSLLAQLVLPAGDGPFPGVLVAHEWWGNTDYPRSRARQLAAQGYAALTVDLYGQGRATASPDEARVWMLDALAQPQRLRMRFEAGLALLRYQPQISAQQIAAIGYCFGGRVVLDMARQGLDLVGVASFHGLLGTDTPAVPDAVTAAILVAHGDADELVTESDVARFEVEMQQAGVQYSLKRYPGAPHAYSNPASPNYRKAADQRAWADLTEFLQRLFD